MKTTYSTYIRSMKDEFGDDVPLKIEVHETKDGSFCWMLGPGEPTLLFWSHWRDVVIQKAVFTAEELRRCENYAEVIASEGFCGIGMHNCLARAKRAKK